MTRRQLRNGPRSVRHGTIEHFSAAPAGIVVGLKPAAGLPTVQLLVDPDLAQEFGERFGVRYSENPDQYSMEAVVGLVVEYQVDGKGIVYYLIPWVN